MAEFLTSNWDKLWTLIAQPLLQLVLRLSKRFRRGIIVKEHELRLRAGFKSPYFVTDAGTETCQLERPLLILCARPLKDMLDLWPVLNLVAHEARPLLVIAPDVLGEVLATLITNHRSGALMSCAISLAPTQDPLAILRELSKQTGAVIFQDEAWYDFRQAKLADLGHVDRVICTAKSTVLVRPAPAGRLLPGSNGA